MDRFDAYGNPKPPAEVRTMKRPKKVRAARICQFMTLLHLAPAIQEYLLYMTTAEKIPLTEPGLRKIAREPRWDRQRAAFEASLRGK